MYDSLIQAEQLQQILEQTIILDCRFRLTDVHYGRRAYEQGHIPDAHYLDLDHDLSSPPAGHTGRHPLPDPARLSRLLASLGLQPRVQVVVYDDNAGAMAARAWWLIRLLGHQAVAVLDGGISAWQDSGLPLHTHEEATSRPVQAAGGADPQFCPGQIIDSSAVVNNLSEPRFTVIDARSPERFSGVQEPIDPVAGHIPGAVNRPLELNLRHGRFKPAEELRREWLALLNGRRPEDIVHMCGSGVTACHNLLAMETAGLPGSRVYAGSWSEWIRDPRRPVAGGPE